MPVMALTSEYQITYLSHDAVLAAAQFGWR